MGAMRTACIALDPFDALDPNHRITIAERPGVTGRGHLAAILCVMYEKEWLRNGRKIETGEAGTRARTGEQG